MPTISRTLTEDVVTGATGSYNGAYASAGTYTGRFGTLVLTGAGQWTYNLNNSIASVQTLAEGQTVNDEFTIVGPMGPTDFVFAINGTNDAPATIATGGGANLVSNGSFEIQSGQGSNIAPTGWTVSGGAGAYVDPARSSDGSGLVVFHGWNAGTGGVLSQTIATVPGQTYVLSFDMGEHLSDTGDNTGKVLIQAISGGTTVLSATGADRAAQASTATGEGYSTYTYTFTATAASTVISFTDQSVLAGVNTDLYFDNVRIWNAAPSVAENATSGTFVGTAVGIDREGMLGLSYSLTDSAGGRFTIDGATGVITVANGSLLDDEAATSHDIIIRATDSGGLSVDKVMTIAVTDGNDAPVLTLGGPNLIANPSFEVDVSGWAGNNGLERTNSAGTFGVSGVADGSYFMEVEGSPGTAGVPSYIESTAATVAGQDYEFSLSAVTRVQFNVGDMFSISANGVEIGRFTTGTNWADYTVRFTATSASTTLRISSQGSVSGSRALASDGVGLLVDNARLYAVSSSPVSYTENDNPVVLNASATVTDLELSAANNFNGATLTLVRNAGARSQDVFSATGTLGALVQGGYLMVGSTIIGAVTANSGGTLVLTFNASATSTLVNAALRQIAYSNTSDNPQAIVKIKWTFNDGNSGGQGSGGALSGTAVTTVNITPVNDAAVISGTSTGTVVEAGGVNNGTAGAPTVSGTLTSSDLDNPANAFTEVGTATPITGGYGSYTMTADGVWTYTLNNNNAAVQALNAGAVLTDTFTVHAMDGTPKVISVTINGSNDAAAIAGVSTGTVVEAGFANNSMPGSPTISGTLTSTDLDNPANAFTEVGTATPITGGYGSYTMTAKGEWTYTLNNENPTVEALNRDSILTDTFTVASTDGTRQVVTITIIATNDLAVISGVTAGTVVEAGGVHNGTAGTPTARGALTSTDVDDPANSFMEVSTATLSTGGYGSFTMTAAGVWSYTLDDSNPAVQVLNAGDTLTDTFTVTAVDGTRQVITISILGADDAAVITGTSTGTVVEAGGVSNGTAGTSTAGGTLTSTDPDNHAGSFIAAASASDGGYGSYTLSAAGEWTYTLDNGNLAVQALNEGDTLTDSFTATSTGGIQQVVSITIHGTDDAAVIAGTSTGAVVEAGGVNNGTAGVPTVIGTLTGTDADGPDGFMVVLGHGVGDGDYGTYTITPEGAWTYTLDNSKPEVQVLNAGDTLTDSFTVTTVDGTTQEVTITINGTNDAAVITGTSTGTAVEAGGVSNGAAGTPAVRGTLASTDDDNPANSFNPVSTATLGMNEFGSYTVTADGVWTYTLNNSHDTVQALNAGDRLIDTFIVTAIDGTQKEVVIAIDGSNDAATIAGASAGTVVEAGGVNNGTAGTPIASGTLSITDVDDPANGFMPVSDPTLSAGTYGTYTLTAEGEWTYTLNNSHAAVQALNAGDRLIDFFVVKATDGTEKEVAIAIDGTDDTAVITGASTGTVVEAGGVSNGTVGTPVASGTLTVADVDNAIDPANSFTPVASASDGGYGSYTLSAAGEWTYTLDNGNLAVQALNEGDTLTDSFTATSTGGIQQVVSITINGTDDAAAVAGNTGAVVEAGGVNNGTAGVPTASGTLSITDVDDVIDPASSTFFATSAATGTGYGTYTVTAAGEWTYILDDSNAAVQAINAGTTLTDSFALDAVNGTQQVVTVTVEGSNDAPTGEDMAATMNEGGYYRVEMTYVNSEYGTEPGHPVDAVRIDNIPSPSVGKLTYGPNNQVVDAEHNVLSYDELQTLIFTPNLFDPSFFGFTDVDAGDALGGVRIDTLPDAQTQGQLLLNGQAVAAGTTIAAANLGDLTFVPVQYFNGVVTFGFTVQDSHGAYAPAGNTATVTVAPINNTPTIKAPTLTYTYIGGGASGQGSLLTGIRFADADSGDSNVTVTLSVMGGGRLVASAQSGVAVSTSNDGLTLTLTGSVQDINSLVYREEGRQYTDEQGGVRYIAPDFAEPQTNGFVTELDDNEKISFVMTTDSGVWYADESLIPVNEAGVKLITVTGQNTTTLKLVGQRVDISEYVNTQSGVVLEEVAYLSTLVNDHGNTGADPGLTGTSTDERAGTVTAVVIQPLNELPGTNVSASDEEGSGFSTDAAAGGGCFAGLWSRWNGYEQLHRDDSIVNEDDTEILQEPYEEAAAAIADAGTTSCIAYAPYIVGATVIGAVAVVLVLESSNDGGGSGGNGDGGGNGDDGGNGDGGGGTGDTPNRAPVITCPSQIPLEEDAQAFQLKGISIADDCDATDTIWVKFTVSAGRLDANPPSGISLQFGDGWVTLTGPISTINDFLTSRSGLKYTPESHANIDITGPVSLGIEVDDLGNGGPGGNLTASATTWLEITPVPEQVGIEGDAEGQISDDVDVDENGMLNAQGKLTVVNDEDALTHVGEFAPPASLAGEYGVFTFNTDDPSDPDYGSWTYRADNGRVDIQKLNAGATLTDTLTVYSVNGGASKTITITINGTDDPPMVVGTSQIYTQDADYRADKAPVGIGNAFTIEDVDSAKLGQVVLRLENRLAGDVLEFNGDAKPDWAMVEATADTITITGVASVEDYQALLGGVTYYNTLPNPDTTGRQFTLAARDEQGMTSEPANAMLDVVSPLSSRIEEFDAAQQASTAVIKNGAPDEAVPKMLDVLMARNNLAQEVHNVLVFSMAQSDALQQLGHSLKEALDKLEIGAHYPAGELTQTHSSLLAETDDVLFEQETGGLVMSETTRAVLLGAANEVLNEAKQDWYRELTRWLDTGVKQADDSYQWSGTSTDVAMVNLLGDLYAGSTAGIPGITHTPGDAPAGIEYIPEEGVPQGEPGAVSTYNSGTLTLTAVELQDVRQRLNLVRMIATNPGATDAQLALIALALVPTYPGDSAVYRADQLLEVLLNKAGIEAVQHTLTDIEREYLPESDHSGTLTDRGVVEWTTEDGQLVFTEATRTALIEQLSEKITLESRQMAALQDALQATAADATTGEYTLTQGMVSLLGTLGVYSCIPPGGTADAYTLSPDMRDRVVAQLVALGPLQVSTDGLALSADLAALNSLYAVTDAPEATLNGDPAIGDVTFKTMAATPEVVRLLDSMGVLIDDVQRYTEMNMQGVLNDRVLACKDNGCTTVYRDSGTLYLPAPVYRAAYDLLSLEYSGSGITTDAAYPLQASHTAPTVSTAPQNLIAATQPSSLADVLDALGHTSVAIQALLPIDTANPDTTIGTGDTYNALKLHMGWHVFEQILADAGLALTNLGSVEDSWTDDKQAQFDATGAYAYTAEGEVVMSPDAVSQLRSKTLLAQYFEQRSELAHHVFGLLISPVSNNGVVVVNGADTASATTLSRQNADMLGAPTAGDDENDEDGGSNGSDGLVAVSAAALLELQGLGVELPAVTARGTQFTQSQIDDVKARPLTALRDEASNTYWMRRKTRNTLMKRASGVMQLSLQLANLLDAENHPADTADISAKALAVKAALHVDDAPGWIDAELTVGQLTETHLVFSVGGDPALVGIGDLGTVYAVDDNGTSKLRMSSATKNALYYQASAVGHATFDAATADAAEQFIAANRYLQVLAGAVSLGDDQPVVIHASADFADWIAAQSAIAQPLGDFSDVTSSEVPDPFAPIGAYAVDGDDIRTSLATFRLWQEAAAKNAADVAGKGDLFTPASLEDLISAAPESNQNNADAQFTDQANLEAAKTNTRAALFADIPDAANVKAAFSAQIALQDAQLAAIEQELLDQPVPNWAASSATDGTGGGFGFLLRHETIDLFGHIDPQLQALASDELGTTGAGDYIISADTRLALLVHMAMLRETYRPLLNNPVHDNAAAASLFDTLDTAGELADLDGLVQLDGAYAPQLEGAVMKLSADSYDDSAPGRQKLVHAPLGTVQEDGAGTLHMSLDTLRLLQAEVAGWVEGTSAPALLSSEQLMAAVAINKLMDAAADPANDAMLFGSLPGLKVSGALIEQAAKIGIALRLVDVDDASATATALADGSALQLGTYTDAGADIVISSDTVAWLEKITLERVQATLSAANLDSQMPTVNPLEHWTADADNYQALQENRVIFDTLLDTFGGKGAVPDTHLLQLDAADLPAYVLEKLNNVGTLKVYTSNEEDSGGLPEGPTHALTWETLKEAEATYHRTLNAAFEANPDVDPDTIDFEEMSATDADGVTGSYSVQTLHHAYLSLEDMDNVYVQDAAGNYILSEVMRNGLMNSVADTIERLQHKAALALISVLGTEDAELTVRSADIKSLLQQLLITPYYTDDADEGNLEHALVYDDGRDTYTMSAATRSYLRTEARHQLSAQNDQAIHGAVDDLAAAYVVHDLADFIAANNQWDDRGAPLVAHAPDDNNPATPPEEDKYVLALQFDQSLYDTLTGAGGVFATTAPAQLGDSPDTRYDSLYTRGSIALDEVNRVIYMTAETYAGRLAAWPANAASDLVCVNAADFADALDENRDWVSYRLVTALDNHTYFDDNLSLSEALNAQPERTVFKDSRGMVWMSNQTAGELGVALSAALSVDDSAIAYSTATEMDPVSGDLLDAFSSDVAPSTNATHYKAYVLDDDTKGELLDLDIHLSEAPDSLEAWQAPPLSTYVVDGASQETWVSEETFRFIRAQLEGIDAWNNAVRSETDNGGATSPSPAARTLSSVDTSADTVIKETSTAVNVYKAILATQNQFSAGLSKTSIPSIYIVTDEKWIGGILENSAVQVELAESEIDETDPDTFTREEREKFNMVNNQPKQYVAYTTNQASPELLIGKDVLDAILASSDRPESLKTLDGNTAKLAMVDAIPNAISIAYSPLVTKYLQARGFVEVSTDDDLAQLTNDDLKDLDNRAIAKYYKHGDSIFLSERVHQEEKGEIQSDRDKDARQVAAILRHSKLDWAVPEPGNSLVTLKGDPDGWKSIFDIVDPTLSSQRYADPEEFVTYDGIGFAYAADANGNTIIAKDDADDLLTWVDENSKPSLPSTSMSFARPFYTGVTWARAALNSGTGFGNWFVLFNDNSMGGLKGVEQMLNRIGIVNSQLNAASRSMAKVEEEYGNSMEMAKLTEVDSLEQEALQSKMATEETVLVGMNKVKQRLIQDLNDLEAQQVEMGITQHQIDQINALLLEMKPYESLIKYIGANGKILQNYRYLSSLFSALDIYTNFALYDKYKHIPEAQKYLLDGLGTLFSVLQFVTVMSTSRWLKAEGKLDRYSILFGAAFLYGEQERAIKDIVESDVGRLQGLKAFLPSPWKLGTGQNRRVVNGLIGIFGGEDKLPEFAKPLVGEINARSINEFKKRWNSEIAWSRIAVANWLNQLAWQISDLSSVVLGLIRRSSYIEQQDSNNQRKEEIERAIARYNLTTATAEALSKETETLNDAVHDLDVQVSQAWTGIAAGALLSIGDFSSSALALGFWRGALGWTGKPEANAIRISAFLSNYGILFGQSANLISGLLNFKKTGSWSDHFGYALNAIYPAIVIPLAATIARRGHQPNDPSYRNALRFNQFVYNFLVPAAFFLLPSLTKETLFRVVGNWKDALNAEVLPEQADLYARILAASSLTSATSLEVLQRSKDAGAERDYYEILGASSLQNEVTSFGVLAYHVLAGQLSIAALSTRDNDNTFVVELHNTAGGLATYSIRAENEGVSNPYIDVDVSESSESSTNNFIVANPHAIIHGGDSLEIYHLFQALNTVAGPDPKQELAGYIVDGFGANTGLDRVMFDMATSGQVIHAGTTYNGLLSYKGIYNFGGSTFDDIFTRYGSLLEDKAWVNYAGGGGKDDFDLRAGNNSVMLDGGHVWLNRDDTPDGGAAEYAALYENWITENNENDVTLLVSDDDGQWSEVYGNVLSFDSVWVESLEEDQGVGLSYHAGDAAATTGWGVNDGYVLKRYINGATGSQFGFFDTNIEAFYGSLFADHIFLDAASTLKVVDGVGGADTIDVDVAGIEVTGGGENSLVKLRAGATAATVYAHGGNAIRVAGASGVTVHAEDNETDVVTDVELQQAAGATVNAGMGSRIAVDDAQSATINIDWLGDDIDAWGGLLDMLPDDPAVTAVAVDASSAGSLAVNANDGYAKLQMGGAAQQATQVHVGAEMDGLWVIADQANALFLDLYFDNPGAEDTVADLQDFADGRMGQLHKGESPEENTGMYTYSGAWRHGETSTQLSLTCSETDASRVRLHFGSGNSATTVTLAAIAA